MQLRDNVEVFLTQCGHWKFEGYLPISYRYVCAAVALCFGIPPFSRDQRLVIKALWAKSTSLLPQCAFAAGFVDAVLGHLARSPDLPERAKYWSNYHLAVCISTS